MRIEILKEVDVVVTDADGSTFSDDTMVPGQIVEVEDHEPMDSSDPDNHDMIIHLVNGQWFAIPEDCYLPQWDDEDFEEGGKFGE